MESLRKRFVDKYGMDAVDLLDKVHLAYPEHINSKTFTLDKQLQDYLYSDNIEVDEQFYIYFVQALTEADVYLGRNEVPVFNIFEVDVPFKVYKPKSSKGTLEDFKPIVGNDDLRPVMSGVYVDNGRLVATDAHVLIHHKDNEFKEYNGKIINLDTYIKSKGRSITFIEGKFPDYDRVTPKKENQKVITEVNVLSLLNYLTGVKALRKNIYNNIFQVVIQFDKETTIAFQSDLLYDALNFIVQKGYEVVEIGYEVPNRAITIYYPKGVALVMPVMLLSEEGTSSGSKKISLETILDEYSSENQMVKTKEKTKKINEKIDVVQEWQDTIATLQELLNEEGVSAQDKEEWEMTIATLEELLKEQKMELGGLVMSYSSPQIVEGIGSFTSQFDGGGVTRKVSKYSIIEPQYYTQSYIIWNSTYGDIMQGFKTREEAQDYIDNVLTKAKDGIKVKDGESEEDNLNYAEATKRWNKKSGLPEEGVRGQALQIIKDNPEILMALEDGGKVFDPNQYELRLEDGDIIKEGKSFKDAFNDMIRLGIFDDKSKKKTNREKIEEAKNKLKAKN
jgi:hypothetical protein